MDQSEVEFQAAHDEKIALRRDAERWRAVRQLAYVVSTGPNSGYYLSTEPLPRGVQPGNFSPDAFADALRALPKPTGLVLR